MWLLLGHECRCDCEGEVGSRCLVYPSRGSLYLHEVGLFVDLHYHGGGFFWESRGGIAFFFSGPGLEFHFFVRESRGGFSRFSGNPGVYFWVFWCGIPEFIGGFWAGIPAGISSPPPKPLSNLYKK